MSEEQKNSPDVTRRTLAKGAAWSVPVLAVAAAAPASAASPEPPECPTCLRSGAIPTPVVSVATNNNGNAALFPFVVTANVNASSCDLSLFKPAYTAIMTAARLTMSDGKTYSSNLGLGTGVGTLGSISAFAFAGNFSGVTLSKFPGLGGTGAYPSNGIRPTKLCIDFNFILIGLPSLIEITCPQTLCWNVSSVPVGVGVGGVGAVTFTSAMTPA